MHSANLGSAPSGYNQALNGSQIDRYLMRAVAEALDVRPTAPGGGLCDWQLKRVRRHIEANIGRSISVAELAGVAKLSLSHFSRCFGISTGMSPHAFIVKARVEHACTLMRETSASLAEIAFQCGLADQSHLSRVFRHVTGSTPSEWRRDALLMRSWHGDPLDPRQRRSR